MDRHLRYTGPNTQCGIRSKYCYDQYNDNHSHRFRWRSLYTDLIHGLLVFLTFSQPYLLKNFHCLPSIKSVASTQGLFRQRQ